MRFMIARRIVDAGVELARSTFEAARTIFDAGVVWASRVLLTKYKTPAAGIDEALTDRRINLAEIKDANGVLTAIRRRLSALEMAATLVA